MTLEKVLAEKPPTWLQVMYERLKHPIINSDTFREKKRTVNNPQIGEKGKKNINGVGKQQKGIKILKDGEMTPGGRPQTYRSTRKQPKILFNNRYSRETVSRVEFKCMYWFLCSICV